VTIRVADRDASQRFYEALLHVLGIELTSFDEELGPEWDDFSLTAATPGHPVTRGLHIGFGAPSREHVDEFWRAGTEAGFTDDGAPGPRPQYRDDYYGAFLLDPDGNSVEAVQHGGGRPPGFIDHLWIRVADVEASARFYETIAPFAGYERRSRDDEIAQFVGAGGSFSVLDGTPTENVHLAFPARDDETVRAFHAAAVAAGYRDNGAPGERPRYHAGYYAAFMLDPDGNNVELVNHNRP